MLRLALGTLRRRSGQALPWLAIAATLTLGGACLVAALGPGAVRPRFAGFLTYRSGAVAPLARAEWPAFAAGLAVRDVVVEVAGVPVAGGPALARALADLPAGADVAITVAAPSGTRRMVLLPVGHLSTADLGYTFVLPFSIGLLYLLLGGVIFVVKRDLTTALTLALCLVASAFYMTMFDAHTAWRFTRIWVCYPLLGPLSVHLFAVFPERHPRWVRRAPLAALYLAGAAAIAWRQATLDNPRATDAAALGSSVMLAAEFLLDLGLLATALRRGSSPAVRNRAKTMFLGMALGMTVVIVWQFASRLGPPAMTADRAMIGSATFPFLIAYALLRRNLFDVDAVLRASVIYALATALVLAVYFAGVAAIGAVAAPLLSRLAPVLGSAQASAVASTLIAAAAFHPLRLRVQRLVDRLLLSDRRAVADELTALAAALPTAGDPSTVADDVVRRLARLARARGVVLLLPNPQSAQRGVELEVAAHTGSLPEGATGVRLAQGGPLARAIAAGARPVAVRDLPPEVLAAEDAVLTALGAELLLPLRARGHLLGVLALGPKRVGIYRYGDLRALDQAAAPVALALDHAQLAAERAAQERLAALGAMAAVIVHEVRNPLGIIKVSAGTLRKRAADDASAELLRCVEDEVDRMDATCRRLLELGRPPAASLRPCDLVDLISGVVERMTPELTAARVRIRCDLPLTPKVTLDPDGMRQALINLLLNARDSMLPDGGDLSIRLRRDPGAVAIEVADTGRGMDEATRRQLFRPFFTTRHGGTGLGLAIIKRIVEEHRGAVHVDSRPGEGARFTITLPVEE